jgi:signal transduction histidine kinase
MAAREDDFAPEHATHDPAIPDHTRAGHDSTGELTFPDLPRLELDQLLGQLVGRAQEVMSTQSRLRGLLRANQMIISDLGLAVVLRRIVDAARELVGARYAALGVIAADGHLAEFLHVGMADERVARIGHLPQGRGLLGALIDDPAPIRLDRLGTDQRSSGFPAEHPPMNSFLGVPIRVRDEVFGNLYLTESTKGEFSAEDEQLVTALAASAGVAIENARLYEAARARQDWLRASAAITRQLLSGEVNQALYPLELIAQSCREIGRADLVTVVLPTTDVTAPGATNGAELRVEVAVGVSGAPELTGRPIPIEGSLSGRVFTTGLPLRVSSPDEWEGLTSAVFAGSNVGPVLVVPLQGSKRMHGVLTAARQRGATAFSAEDLDMAAGFANQASVAIELAEARAEQQRAAMLDERDRIASDLHDHVIQQLFAIGLSLQSTISGLPAGNGKDRVHAAIDALDETISHIRTSIFALRTSPDALPVGVRARLLEVVTPLNPVLGFEPAVRFTGAFEHVPPESVIKDLLAVLREALSNIARHAYAHTATVTVTATREALSLDVVDDGIGIGPTTRRSGLANLHRRAAHHGGTLTLTPHQPTGTRLNWTIPLNE